LLQVFSIVDNYLWVIHRRQNPNRLTSAEFQGVFPEMIGSNWGGVTMGQ